MEREAAYPLRGAGVVQVTVVVTTGIKPQTTAAYPMSSEITGTRRNGRNRIGFKITGNPNTSGSFILNTPKGREHHASRRFSWDRENSSRASSRHSVAPLPPMSAKLSTKDLHTTALVLWSRVAK